MEEKAKEVAQLLKLLANENRLMLLCALMEGPKSVGELAKIVPRITQSALSQHLTLLRTHGILDFTKYGQSITYSISDERVVDIMALLKKNCCDTIEGEHA